MTDDSRWEVDSLGHAAIPPGVSNANSIVDFITELVHEIERLQGQVILKDDIIRHRHVRVEDLRGQRNYWRGRWIMDFNAGFVPEE